MVVTQYKIPSFWPLLSILQKGGFFPCKKVTNIETQKVTMQPWNGFIQGLVYIICSSSIFAFMSFGYYQLYSTSYGTVFDFFIELYQVGSSLQKSSFDLKVLMTIYALIFFMHAATLAHLIISKNALCDVYNYFNEHASIDFKLISMLMKPFSIHLIKIAFLMFTGWPVYITGLTLNILEGLKYEFAAVIPFMIALLLLLMWGFAPIMAFHLYFLEIALLLNSWILTFQEKLKYVANLTVILQECKKIHVGLQMFASTISKLIFCLFVIILIFGIIEAYLMIAFFISQDDFTLANIFLMLGYACFGCLYLFFAYNYCNFSQCIKDSVDGIKNTILDFEINEYHQVCIIDGKVTNIEHAKNRIISGLNAFQGFHGDGYFILGKELLTSIVANFVTYLIILVQFKVSELST